MPWCHPGLLEGDTGAGRGHWTLPLPSPSRTVGHTRCPRLSPKATRSHSQAGMASRPGQTGLGASCVFRFPLTWRGQSLRPQPFPVLGERCGCRGPAGAPPLTPPPGPQSQPLPARLPLLRTDFGAGRAAAGAGSSAPAPPCPAAAFPPGATPASPPRPWGSETPLAKRLLAIPEPRELPRVWSNLSN